MVGRDDSSTWRLAPVTHSRFPDFFYGKYLRKYAKDREQLVPSTKMVPHRREGPVMSDFKHLY
jgi:hypothetical protein